MELMDSPLQLPFRDKPKNLEPFLGLLLRVSEMHSYPHMGWITTAARLSPGAVTGRPDLQSMASLLGVSEGELQKRVYAPGGSAGASYLSFYGSSLPRAHLRPYRPRICPACILEQGYVSALWDLSLLAVCPSHRTVLVDRCKGCNAPLSWHRPGLTICKCGFDLTGAAPRPATPEATAVASCIVNRAGVGTDSAPAASLPGEVLSFSLPQLLATILLIGSHAPEFADTSGSRRRGTYLCSRLDTEGMHDLLDLAGRALTRWPIGFYEYLERLRGRLNDYRYGTGLARDFGNFYSTLYRGRNATSLGFLQAAFEKYLENVWDNGVINAKNSRINSAEIRQKFVPRATAARLLHARIETVDTLILHGAIKGMRRRMSSRVLRLVDRESIEAYLAGRQLRISLSKAAEKLGVTVAAIEYCIDAGFLTRYSESDSSVTVARAELDALLTRLRSSVVPRAACAGPTWSFGPALRRLSFLGVTAADLLGAVLRNRLVPIGYDDLRAGVSGLKFDIQEVMSLLYAHRRRPVGMLTVPQAALVLHLAEKVVYSLVEHEVLKAKAVRERGTIVRLVPQSEIKRFRQGYVAASELAAAFNTSPRTVIDALTRKRIRPATGPGWDGGIQTFFRRSGPLIARLQAALAV